MDTKITIVVCPTTGGQFNITVSPHETVENLRKKIGRHLQTPHERLNVLFKEKVLSHGKISEHNLQDGSKLILLPLVESGFSSTVQGTQQSIIQAIESLSDLQIDDFLSGRSPLTLALRVGDHMMFVQLQLEQSATGNFSPADMLSRSMGSHHAHSLEQSSQLSASSTSSLFNHNPNSSTRPGSNVARSGAEQRTCDTQTNPLNRLAGLTQPCSSNQSADQQASNGKQISASLQRRTSTTCGKITSGVGPLSSHHGPPGSRVVRQMQRLRRLCSAHQQCVVYSNRELASEISSIVHAAKHLSEPTGGTSRRSSKSLTRDRGKVSSHSPSMATSQSPGASIDSVTTHGPGIFSGTFSGSLHPNIQDSDGKPKRDPQTILQILTDLLSATNHYEGQTGNIGMLPQLFKDHFNKQTTQQKQEKQSHHKHSTSRRLPGSPNSLPYHPYKHLLCGGEQMYGGDVSSPFPLRQNIRKSTCAQSCLDSWYPHMPGRRTKKQASTINLPRLHQLRQENGLTRHKMHLLREEMKARRMRRQSRRDAAAPYSKQVSDESQCLSHMSVKQSSTNDVETVSSSDLDMDIDDIGEYTKERKAEVAHETPETVIV